LRKRNAERASIARQIQAKAGQGQAADTERQERAQHYETQAAKAQAQQRAGTETFKSGCATTFGVWIVLPFLLILIVALYAILTGGH
jgi:cobalamin biosynthesis Mg chelatase CobN